jgi:hypothetical protein
MPVQCTCVTCGTTFFRKPSEVGELNFCSHACAYQGRRPGGPPPPPPPPAILNDDGVTASIPLLAKDGTLKGHALIDAADAAWASQWTWRLTDDGYAHRSEKRNGKPRHFSLHRELLGLTYGDTRQGDHIDRNRLNARRDNLRIIPRGVNGQNVGSRKGSTSSHRGVAISLNGTWRAQVGKVFIGSFATEREAAEAAREARLKMLPYAVD